jgi:hypothetical protein
MNMNGRLYRIEDLRGGILREVHGMCNGNGRQEFIWENNAITTGNEKLSRKPGMGRATRG